ncbi:hypothetical protein, partial [Thermogutta sp.]|uniref:hypothetical protein n=1 Tax=Thermogutta sp. TaxID=1962930 RepID=UPI0025F825FA
MRQTIGRDIPDHEPAVKAISQSGERPWGYHTRFRAGRRKTRGGRVGKSRNLNCHADAEWER